MKQRHFPVGVDKDGDKLVFLPDDVEEHDQNETDEYFDEEDLLIIGANPPDDEDRVSHAVHTHLAEPLDADAVKYLIEHGRIGRYAEELLGARGEEDEYAQSATRALTSGSVLDHQAQHATSWPNPNLRSPKDLRLPESVANNSMIIIGDGPATILLARMRHEMGYLPGATRIFSKAGKTGGIWNHGRVVDEGHNTFADATAFGEKLRTDTGRDGQELVDFLRNIARPIENLIEKGVVDGVEFDAEKKKYVVRYVIGKISCVAMADSVCIATGTGVPAPLSSDIMKTNADEVPGINRYMKRWQEQIAEPGKLEGTTPMFVGLGNSTIGVLRQLKELQEQGMHFEPKVLTHHSLANLQNPKQLFVRRDGVLNEPLARSRSDLTKLAVDIPHVEETLDYAMEEGWILDSVSEWNVDPDALKNDKKLRVTVKTRRSIAHVIEPDRIHALIGYRNQPDFMRKLGCADVSDEGFVGYENFTHRVKTDFKNDPKRLYIMGAAASVPWNRNEEVIPGMMGVVGKIAFAEAVAGHRKAAAAEKAILNIGENTAFLKALSQIGYIEGRPQGKSITRVREEVQDLVRALLGVG